MRGVFSRFEHCHSDSEAYLNAVRRYKQEQDSLKLAGPFVVTAIPFAPRGACAFEEFDYMEDPAAVRLL